MLRDRQIRWALLVAIGIVPAAICGCLKSSNVRSSNGPDSTVTSATPPAGRPNGPGAAAQDLPPAAFPIPTPSAPMSLQTPGSTSASSPSPSSSGSAENGEGMQVAPTPMLDAAEKRLRRIKEMQLEEPPAETAAPRRDDSVERTAAVNGDSKSVAASEPPAENLGADASALATRDVSSPSALVPSQGPSSMSAVAPASDTGAPTPPNPVPPLSTPRAHRSATDSSDDR